MKIHRQIQLTVNHSAGSAPKENEVFETGSETNNSVNGDMLVSNFKLLYHLTDCHSMQI